jgi:hypothetical protein
MSRAFSIQINATPDLAFSDAIHVEDGDDVRFHDVALVVEVYLAQLRRRGSEKVPTRSMVLAEKAKLDAANRVMADWEPTADAVNTNILLGGATTFSRTWVKKGYSEPVEAPCNGQGGAIMETADVLAKWGAPAPQAEA